MTKTFQSYLNHTQPWLCPYGWIRSCYFEVLILWFKLHNLNYIGIVDLACRYYWCKYTLSGEVCLSGFDMVDNVVKLG